MRLKQADDAELFPSVFIEIPQKDEKFLRWKTIRKNH